MQRLQQDSHGETHMIKGRWQKEYMTPGAETESGELGDRRESEIGRTKSSLLDISKGKFENWVSSLCLEGKQHLVV